MAVAAFDTYAAAKTLREAGFDERQAEAAVAMVHGAVIEGVATKADLRAAIADLKADLLKVAIGLVIANVAFTATLTVALIKLLA